MRQRSFFAPIAILALALTACAGGGGATDPVDEEVSAGPDQSIVVGTQEGAWLDIHKAFDNNSRVFFGRVYDELYTIDDDGAVVPYLATALPKKVGENTYEIELKTGVKFSDGTPFNADDAVFSINRAISPAVATLNAEIKKLTGATKVDDNTIKVTTTANNPLLANSFVNGLRMMSSGLTDITQMAQWIGTGPYKFVSHTPGIGAVLTYNDQYWGDKPQVTDVEIRFIPDPATRVQALVAGEVDVVPSITPTQARSTPNAAISDLNEGSFYARFNTLTGPLTDVRLRQALNYAVDREAIVETIFDGTATPSQCTLLPMGVVGTSENIKSPYTYDPEKAKDLIADAEYDGTPLLLWSSNGSYAEDRAVNQLLAQQFEEVGFNIDLQISDSHANFAKRMAVGGAVAPDITPVGHSNNLASVNRVLDTWVIGPVSSYVDAEVNATIKEAQNMDDQKAAQRLYDEAQQTICDDAGYLFLFDFQALHGLSERLRWTPTPVSVSNLIMYDEMKVVKTDE